MSDDAVAFLPIAELGARLRSGQISPVELAKLYLARLGSIGVRFNAVVTITEDIALREATLAEAELRSDSDRGPLHGIPYGTEGHHRDHRDTHDMGGRAVSRPAVRARGDGCTPAARCWRGARGEAGDDRARPAEWATTTRTPRSPARPPIPGTPAAGLMVRRAVRGQRSLPVRCRSRSAATPADRSFSPPRSPAWLGCARPMAKSSRFGAMTLCWTLEQLARCAAAPRIAAWC